MKVGPLDHGRKMSLRAFEFVETEPDYHYELSRGYVTASEVANFIHALIVSMIRDSLGAYRIAHPKFDHLILNGMECKLLIADLESERHPDIAVYLTRPKGPKNRTIWRRWIPALVIEVVSAESDHRDYCEKRDEYWTLGVKEYWIVDAKRAQIVMLRRGKSDWIEKRLTPDCVCTSKLLPGFTLAGKPIFDAAAAAADDEA
jgi:Uma2 family endonuclease